MYVSELKIGMAVCFKSDVEQCGVITKIYRENGKISVMVRHMGNGFEGDYLQDQDTTILSLDDIWI